MPGPWVFRDGELVERRHAAPLARGPRSGLSAPMLINDHLPDLVGPGGKRYSSKSALRREYKARGLVELGNDAPTQAVDNRKRVTKAEIGEALQMVKQGYKPAPLETAIVPDE